MATESMVERAARALCASDGHDPDGANASSCGDPFWMFYVPKVRAVFHAIREPTTAMTEAGGSRLFAGSRTQADTLAVDTWQAMLDAANQ